MNFGPTSKMLAGVLALGTSGLALAGTTTPAESTQLDSLRQELAQLRQSNNSLQQQVAQLRTDQGENWLNARRAEEVKALVKEVLADADTRASLLEGGMTAGYKKNFFLASEDGSFMLKIKGQIQFRYIAAFRDGQHNTPGAGTANDDLESGFTIRRAKINFGGHIGSPKLGYDIQLAVDRGSNTAIADKIKISYDINDCWSLWFGEDKAPFLREELISSSKQMAVERSYVNEIFTVDKVQGVALEYSSDMIKGSVMISDGLKSGDGSGSAYRFTQLDDYDAQPVDRTGISKDFDDDASDFALTARIDAKLAGDWKQWEDFTAWDGEEMAVFVGAAIHWEEGETGDGFDNNDFFAYTVDTSLEVQRFSAYMAFIGLHTNVERQAAVAAQDYNIFGFVGQVAYQIPMADKQILEPFIRYEWVDFDNAISTAAAPATADDEVQLITVGFNYYFAKHAAKFTLDVVYAFDAIPIGEAGLGLNSDRVPAGGIANDDQTVIRAQFQLLF